MNELPVEDFLNAPGVIIDVRSPAEYAQSRIPSAVNLPLLDNTERAQVGTAYKKLGRETAVELGFGLVGPKLANLISEAKQILGNKPAKIHCWRGGLRSNSMLWLLETSGIPTVCLKGGYKAFRRFVLQKIEEYSLCEKSPKFLLVGGLTGTGKTMILHALQSLGEQILDLEGLARHRGSTYGMLGQPAQPSVEQFENEIASFLKSFDLNRPIWIEDESRMIGKCKIPDPLFKKMQHSTLFLIHRPLSERLQILYDHYSQFDPNEIITATQRIGKHLGGAKTKEVITLIQGGNLKEAIMQILHYYDSSYRYGLTQRQNLIHNIDGEQLSKELLAKLLIQQMARPYSH